MSRAMDRLFEADCRSIRKFRAALAILVTWTVAHRWPVRFKFKFKLLLPNFIEQAAHCDHKPRAAWMIGRLFKL